MVGKASCILFFVSQVKGFAAFSPQVFVSQWPSHWNSRLLAHSCSLIRNNPECLPSFVSTLFSRSNSLSFFFFFVFFVSQNHE